MNKNRLEAFSDGVLAIIITIMVLEIKEPEGGHWKDLVPLFPVFLSYVFSFTYIGIYWGNHHHLLHSVKQVSSQMIWANINLLFWLSLIPFATGWMGENNFEPDTVALYGIDLLLSGLSFFLLQKAVEKNSHDLDELRKAFAQLNKKGIASTIAYTLAIPFAYINLSISAFIFIVISIVWLIPDKNLENAMKNNTQHS
jgi:uncharacterized membrane protein